MIALVLISLAGLALAVLSLAAALAADAGILDALPGAEVNSPHPRKDTRSCRATN